MDGLRPATILPWISRVEMTISSTTGLELALALGNADALPGSWGALQEPGVRVGRHCAEVDARVGGNAYNALHDGRPSNAIGPVPSRNGAWR